MMFRTHIRIAFEALRANRVRTGLTTLGVIIGVAAVTFVLALGQGAREAVSYQVGKLDGNIIVIKPGQTGFRDISAYNPYNTAITSTLTERDYRTVEKSADVDAVAPLMFISGSVKNGDTPAGNAPIIATSDKFDDILGLTLKSGEFISDTTARDTIVLGQQLAIELFGTDQAMGQELLVKGRPHTVIGVIKNTRQPINLAGVDLDHGIYTSLDNGKSFNQGIAQIQQLAVRAKGQNNVNALAQSLNRELLVNHEGEQDFAVLAGDKIAKGADQFFGSILLITSLVAGVAIIVGGIGIMNIMLVSVTERTREIGIRKAVGATDSQIVWQFLVEALIMSLSGGIIGLIVAYGLAYIVGSQLFFMPALSWGIILGSLGLAVGVGVVFGLYPAVKAARKDPIEALRQYQ